MAVLISPAAASTDDDDEEPIVALTLWLQQQSTARARQNQGPLCSSDARPTPDAPPFLLFIHSLSDTRPSLDIDGGGDDGGSILLLLLVFCSVLWETTWWLNQDGHALSLLYITLSRQMDGKVGRKKEMQSEYTYLSCKHWETTATADRLCTPTRRRRRRRRRGYEEEKNKEEDGRWKRRRRRKEMINKTSATEGRWQMPHLHLEKRWRRRRRW